MTATLAEVVARMEAGILARRKFMPPSDMADDIEILIAEIRRLEPLLSEAGGWQDISAAPTDGRWLNLRYKSMTPFVGRFCCDEREWADENGAVRDPTHFAELPTPPEAADGKSST